MEAAVQELLRNAGILGPIVIFFGWYILLKDRQIKDLQNQLKEANEARVKDAQGQVAELMGLNDKWVAALNANTVVLSEIKTLIAILRAKTGESSDDGERRGGKGARGS
jgi:endo-beta-N-acetylglucosaminidase D